MQDIDHGVTSKKSSNIIAADAKPQHPKSPEFWENFLFGAAKQRADYKACKEDFACDESLLDSYPKTTPIYNIIQIWSPSVGVNTPTRNTLNSITKWFIPFICD